MTLNIPKLAAATAALLMISASAGFGAHFAWTTNAAHGPALAWCAVAMALGLELAKPLAMHALLEALRTWRLLQAVALAIVAGVAVLYSLTAEIQLVARGRADLVAQREGRVETAASVRRSLASHKAEFDALANSRPVGEVAALINGHLADARLQGCVVTLETQTLRDKCTIVAKLRAEHARAETRAVLITRIEAAERIVQATGPAAAVDPSAVAIATYLHALGIYADETRIGDWLILVFVFALEAGSVFGFVLVQAVGGTPARPVSKRVPTSPAPAPVVNAVFTMPNTPETPANTALTAAPVTPALPAPETLNAPVPNSAQKLVVPDDPAERLVQLLTERGGEVFGSQRTIAAALGLPLATVNRLLRDANATGRVHVEATNTGTRVRLAA